ncbi:mechanosensitive ion channel family protein [Candidatus Woesearchaeota archaeon]|nr:mechanosensitive ion channel family protein [Candidatus Woesearchaeota archaeon]
MVSLQFLTLDFLPILRTMLVAALLLLVFGFIVRRLKKFLLKRARTRAQYSNIEIFSRVLQYSVLVIVIISALFAYSGSWAGLGLSVGLLSAALGWALQKPITGVAAWVMLVIKRPFQIGDRIIIGDVKGDVVDITLTHIYIGEIGGLVAGEERSERTIMVPNSLLFEQKIINYNFQTENILDQVTVQVTYESNIDKAIELALRAARKHIKQFGTDKEAFTRTYFQPSGVNVHVRYLVPAQRVQELSSLITKELLDLIRKTKDVEIAVPHTAVVLRGKMYGKKNL